jgi:hypothetical protein
VTIAYPDEGAWKRFHYQFKDEGYPEVICTKVRDGAKRIVRLKVSRAAAAAAGGLGCYGDGQQPQPSSAAAWQSYCGLLVAACLG